MKNILSYVYSSLTHIRKKPSVADSLIHNFTVLPFDIRYAMQYKKGIVNHEELGCVLDESFGRGGLYLMMKLYQDNVYIQRSILDVIISHSHEKHIVYQKLQHIHKAHPTTTCVQGHKLGILSKYNFSGWDKAFSDMAVSCSDQGQTPIILLYAGSLALPSFLSYYKGDVIRLCNPKNPQQTIKIFRDNEQWQYVYTTLEHIDTNHVFIDDVYNTGAAHTMANAILTDLGFDVSLSIDTAVNMQALENLRHFRDRGDRK